MRKYLRRLIACTAIVGTLFSSFNSYAGGRVYTNGVHVYVSKMQHTITLYQGSQVIGSWECSIGNNSKAGDKQQEGDKITPSGSFYVCTRNDQSIAYLSLGLSYPSTDDADRGYREGIITLDQKNAIYDAIKKGEQPPWDTPLGGAIMIHGNRQLDTGTSGCVAVDNNIMDIFWQYCELKTPVEIGP